MIRLFVALSVPEDIGQVLSSIMVGMPGARWLDEAGLHLTLRFIGEVDGVQRDAIARGLSRIDSDAFELALSGVGHFPPKGEPRILWAGVDKSAELDALRKKVDGVITRLGHKSDRKRWAPHVTIARLSGTPQGRLLRFLSEQALLRTPPFDVTEFHLYSSRLHPKGAVYERVQTFELRDISGGWRED